MNLLKYVQSTIIILFRTGKLLDLLKQGTFIYTRIKKTRDNETGNRLFKTKE